ncbi:MAG: DegT/DnrJ/EryC1/StrS family aminotransferase [Candidatus Merdivicinus sp.]|jgi:perosamine synthetase
MEQLALLGGPQAVTLDYETVGNLPRVPEGAYASVEELMRKGEISFSPLVRKFEERFAAYVGAKYALAINNGTSSLHTALFAVGIQPGDEVLVPSYTFWATVVPVVSAHGVPVFCDVDPETFCITPEEIEKHITPKTKAIMLVHVWGNPCDMDGILAVAKKHGLKVIEDCSHAHGATYHGKKVGTLGDVGCFSLQESKLLPAGEGGILVTNEEETYQRAVALGQYDRIAKLPDDSPYKKYVLTGMGYKFRPHPLAIAIANAGLDELDEHNAIRNRGGKLLEDSLADLPFLTPQKVLPGCEREYAYQYVCYHPEKFGGVSTYTLLKALHAEGVRCGYCAYGRLHFAPLFMEGGAYGDCGARSKSDALPVTERLAVDTIMIAPRFEKECEELIRQYSEAYHKVAAHLDELVQYDREHEEDVRKDPNGSSVSLFR